MQAQWTLERVEKRSRLDLNLTEMANEIVARLTVVLGCWHRRMSRPFSLRGETYRACLSCGAHRQFNLKEWRSEGVYYFKAARS